MRGLALFYVGYLKLDPRTALGSMAPRRGYRLNSFGVSVDSSDFRVVRRRAAWIFKACRSRIFASSDESEIPDDSVMSLRNPTRGSSVGVDPDFADVGSRGLLPPQAVARMVRTRMSAAPMCLVMSVSPGVAFGWNVP